MKKEVKIGLIISFVLILIEIIGAFIYNQIRKNDELIISESTYFSLMQEEKMKFNKPFEEYVKSYNTSISLTDLINKIIDSNNENSNHQIAVNFFGTEYSDNYDRLKNRKIEAPFFIEATYNDEGYIDKILIAKNINETIGTFIKGDNVKSMLSNIIYYDTYFLNETRKFISVNNYNNTYEIKEEILKNINNDYFYDVKYGDDLQCVLISNSTPETYNSKIKEIISVMNNSSDIKNIIDYIIIYNKQYLSEKFIGIKIADSAILSDSDEEVNSIVYSLNQLCDIAITNYTQDNIDAYHTELVNIYKNIISNHNYTCYHLDMRDDSNIIYISTPSSEHYQQKIRDFIGSFTNKDDIKELINIIRNYNEQYIGQKNGFISLNYINNNSLIENNYENLQNVCAKANEYEGGINTKENVKKADDIIDHVWYELEKTTHLSDNSQEIYKVTGESFNGFIYKIIVEYSVELNTGY